MREIKFRAWDGRNNFMTDGVVIMNADINFGIRMLEREGWALMQYTGLKDKNGVEIYEEDILAEYDGRVIWIDDAWYVNHAQGEVRVNTQLSQWLRKRERAGIGTEVVGNIYENPELLQSEAG